MPDEVIERLEDTLKNILRIASMPGSPPALSIEAAALYNVRELRKAYEDKCQEVTNLLTRIQELNTGWGNAEEELKKAQLTIQKLRYNGQAP